jgi:tetratricopeptide (TPR) repeat protein
MEERGMYRRDYIMRQIEYMVEVMQQVSGLAAEKRHQAAMTVINESLEELFGLNGTLVTRLFGREPLTQLTFGEETDLSQAKLIAAAALLQEAGSIEAELGADDKSYTMYASALELLLAALLNHDGSPLPEYAPEVEELTAVLDPFHLPPHLNQLLLRYYHKTGQYDQAENVLFEMLEDTPEDEAIIKLGITFYQLILQKSDAHLEAGNLPRDEAEASLAELLARRGEDSGSLGFREV